MPLTSLPARIVFDRVVGRKLPSSRPAAPPPELLPAIVELMSVAEKPKLKIAPAGPLPVPRLLANVELTIVALPRVMRPVALPAVPASVTVLPDTVELRNVRSVWLKMTAEPPLPPPALAVLPVTATPSSVVVGPETCIAAPWNGPAAPPVMVTPLIVRTLSASSTGEGGGAGVALDGQRVGAGPGDRRRLARVGG